ncbi:MAG: cobalamin B12-binding domain-containing protein [Deltaproteobacteria bacterium]|uniref:Cobalamin B12-binding domain-containing protein n=1 Tax=Candidatus Desulfacyla euxinica TaxID=2841693 RepID=A0A8J6N3F6_9DELT|nr:cobalamin B12-binding domain-containing protein [Candidatus Desulfacyla euxinica]
MTKVLLWNSTLGKVYSTSDGFLDNGLALLKAACENNGIQVLVEDPADIDFLDSFVKTDLPDQKSRFGYTSKELSLLLNNLAPDVFTPIIPDSEKVELKKKWDNLQEILSAVTEEKMERYLDELVEWVVQEKIDIVGIKAWLGKRFVCTERLAEKITKACPETFVVAGGPQANNFHEEVLVGNKIDLAVYLEGEKTLVQLAELIGRGKEAGQEKSVIMEMIVEEARKGEICNLIYRDNGQIRKSGKGLLPMSAKPMPKYDSSPGKVNIAVVEDELGCYYRKGCALCGHDNAMGGYRTQKIDHLMEQIRELICHDVGLFRFSSSATSSAKGAKIARRILEEGINLEFSMFTRAENNAKARYWKLIERYETMIEAGLRAIFLGVEAANQEILNNVMEKGNSVDDMFYTVLALKESAKKKRRHVDVGVSFIYPVPLLPDSTVTQEELLEDNMDFLRRLEERGCKADSVLITPACPLPGTRWLTEKDKFGFEVPDDFLQVWLRYNYELAKDPKTWPDVPIGLNGKSWEEMVDSTSAMGKRLFEAGYAINLTDEHCLSARASGMLGKWGLVDFY